MLEIDNHFNQAEHAVLAYVLVQSTDRYCYIDVGRDLYVKPLVVCHSVLHYDNMSNMWYIDTLEQDNLFKHTDLKRVARFLVALETPQIVLDCLRGDEEVNFFIRWFPPPALG